MTVAETLRAWAADADEDMAAPLRELAAQYETELTAARQETERNVLAPVAEVLGCEAETFAMIAAATKLVEFEGQTNAAMQARQGKIEAAKAKVAAAVERRQRGRNALQQAVTLLRQADLDIEVSDMTEAQIAERTAGRH